MKISKSQEDYLKLIWYLERDQVKATAKTVSDLHAVKPPTALSMFGQLSKNGWIRYNKEQGARLTTEGNRLARKLVRKHRLIETFLKQILKMDKQLLHEEAELLEHVVSDNLMYRIDAFLGFPDKDPHGSPIPLWDEEIKTIFLNRVETGKSFKVQEILLDKNLSRYYEQRSFKQGSFWTMSELAPDKSSLMVTNGKIFLPFSGAAAAKINVLLHV